MKKKRLHKLWKLPILRVECKEQQEETKIRIAMFHVKNEMFIHKKHLPTFEQQVSVLYNNLPLSSIIINVNNQFNRCQLSNYFRTNN